eukprot:scaffold1620_cov233-Pinguiococcus_pyrenoidosus.AAC.10
MQQARRLVHVLVGLSVLHPRTFRRKMPPQRRRERQLPRDGLSLFCGAAREDLHHWSRVAHPICGPREDLGLPLLPLLAVRGEHHDGVLLARAQKGFWGPQIALEGPVALPRRHLRHAQSQQKGHARHGGAQEHQNQPPLRHCQGRGKRKSGKVAKPTREPLTEPTEPPWRRKDALDKRSVPRT